MHQIDLLYTLNSHNIECQLYLNKAGKNKCKRKKILIQTTTRMNHKNITLNGRGQASWAQCVTLVIQSLRETDNLRWKEQDSRLCNSRSTAGRLAEAGTLEERRPLPKMVQKHFAFSLPPALWSLPRPDQPAWSLEHSPQKCSQHHSQEQSWQANPGLPCSWAQVVRFSK